MKTFKEFSEAIMATHFGIKGEEGHSYDKWGKQGIEGWKAHVKKVHGDKVEYKHEDKGEFSKTHAHKDGKEIGQFSHYNNSSKTLK